MTLSNVFSLWFPITQLNRNVLRRKNRSPLFFYLLIKLRTNNSTKMLEKEKTSRKISFNLISRKDGQHRPHGYNTISRRETETAGPKRTETCKFTCILLEQKRDQFWNGKFLKPKFTLLTKNRKLVKSKIFHPDVELKNS